MSVEIRPLRGDEMGKLGAMGAYAYAGAFGDDEDGQVTAANLPEWTLCAMDNGTLCSSFVAVPFTMRANGNAIPMAGVTVIGTHPEYRRRGLVRRIHTAAFERMREQGQPVASLWASQAAIYQRYGYAQSTYQRQYDIDSVDIRFADADFGRGDVRRFRGDEAFAQVKQLYIAFIAQRSGYLHRSKPLWQANALQEQPENGPVHVAISFAADDQPNGYLIYTLRHSKVAHAARPQEIIVRDFIWSDLDAYRSLWHWLARHDLVGRVHWPRAPVDDPAPLLLAEPRLLHAQDHEGMWTRLVDIEAAIAGRGYTEAAEFVIDVPADSLAPWNEGRWHIETGPEGARARRTDRPAQLQLTLASLSLLYMGTYRARDLAARGLIEGDAAAIAAADRGFATRYRPHCPDHF